MFTVLVVESLAWWRWVYPPHFVLAYADQNSCSWAFAYHWMRYLDIPFSFLLTWRLYVLFQLIVIFILWRIRDRIDTWVPAHKEMMLKAYYMYR